MADQVPITPGSGVSVSTDDAGASGQIQRVKLTYSADGDATHIPADANGLDSDVTRIAGKTPAYTEGDTDATIDGVPLLWEDTADTLRAASAAKPLPVNIITGASAGTQYTEADVDATITGMAVMWEDTADTLRATSAAKPLPVNVITGSTAGVQYTEGDVDATITGTAVMWEDAANTLKTASAASPMPVTAPAATRTTHSITDAVASDAIMSGLTAMTPKFVSITVTAGATDSTVIASVASRKLRVIAFVCQCGGVATDLTLESGTSTRIHKVPAGANGGQSLSANPWGWFETTSGAALTATTGAGSSTEITIAYLEVP